MNTERAQVGWRFGLWWVLASTVGLVGGWYAFLAMPKTIPYILLGPTLSVALPWAVQGVSVGITQWLVLRRQVSMSGWWVLASAVGLSVGPVAYTAVHMDVRSALRGALDITLHITVLLGLLVGILQGASIGIAQWLVLRRQVSRSGWWVLASTVGLVVNVVVGIVWSVAVGVEGGWVVSSVVGGVLYGAITGGVLIWQLRQRVEKERGPRQATE